MCRQGREGGYEYSYDAVGAHHSVEDRNFLPHIDTIYGVDGLVKDVVTINLMPLQKL
jgi:hypothetical protein